MIEVYVIIPDNPDPEHMLRVAEEDLGILIKVLASNGWDIEIQGTQKIIKSESGYEKWVHTST